MRNGTDGVEHYFTIKTDGTDEIALFDAEGCSCARWSADGSLVLTLAATDHGTYSFKTIRPDGTDAVVVPNPIETLNLAPGASSADGRLIAFNGWDETDPANTGLWVASPDLTDLRMVMPLQEGMLTVEPFGVTPDGSQIVFFADTGPQGETSHAGDVYVVNADGTSLRQLNPAGTKTGFIGPAVLSLSPDGRQAAFGLGDAVWVVDLAGGEARPITYQAGFVWAVTWSPSGDWIAYTRQHAGTSVIGLVRPDGTDDHEITANDATDEAAMPMWSPEGTHLLVRRGGGEDGDLWIVDLEGTWVGQVTHEPSDYSLFSWAP
ncbi:MAG TPA: hypothetical protein VFH90_06035 [Candidatus Limnocylindria bacterium]|nr:hypothetical protein [Candidatus Limnocylindria bacterium]